MEFQSLVQSRRSSMKFLEDIHITKKDFEDIFSLVKYAPSAFNLQHTHYIVITDEKKKKDLYEVTNKQYKFLTASAAILVLGDISAYKNAGALFEGKVNLGILNKQEFEHEVRNITQFYENKSEDFRIRDAIQNASISAMLFMLTAKDRGWDTCPMYSLNPEKLKEMFKIPDNLLPVLLITIGKEDESKIRQRGYRKPIGEFVTYESF